MRKKIFYVQMMVWGLPAGGFGIRLAKNFGGFFLSNKSSPANRKKDFHTSHPPNEIRGYGEFSY
jgi:hypothetical protein